MFHFGGLTDPQAKEIEDTEGEGTAINYIARRAGEGRVIPAGSTYKIRGPAYTYRGARAYPSYTQAGPSFFIEKSKRRMIAEDIGAALRLVRQA